ncbi:MAG: hypothetical protein GXP30_08185, partial [Verrucomicrobia bacterium]|nr:hypothetical protein [Verrucomicrobiota bacterium]
GFDAAKGQMALYQLGQMGFVEKFVLKRNKIKEREFDFSYKLLTEEIAPRRQKLKEDGSILQDEAILPITTELSDLPNDEKRYGFWGCTKQHKNGKFLKVTPKCETDLRYDGVGEYNQMYLFRTPEPYRSYKEYQGCSGAPILSEDGELVALAVEGNKKKTGIFGLPIHTIRPLFDVEILQAEQVSADQPATAQESMPEEDSEPKPESKVRPQ